MREEFEKWAHQEGLDLTSWTIGYFTTLTNGAFKGWNARQPEIDALRAESAHLHNKLIDEILARQELGAENERLRSEIERLSPREVIDTSGTSTTTIRGPRFP